MKKRHLNQIGSTTTFVVISMVLTVCLVCVVYILKQHSEQARKDQAIAAYNRQQANKKSTEVANKPASNNSSNNQQPDPDSNVLKQDNLTQNLPVTGSSLDITEIVGIGLLTVALTSYIESRHS
jgi:hypothetical protein